MKEKIYIDDWARKKAFKTFCDFDDPYTGVTTQLDVTNLVYMCKYMNSSFYGTMLYFVLMSMNGIDAYKYGYGKTEDDAFSVYKYDDIAATFTVLTSENELNFSRYVKFDCDYQKFMQNFSEAKLAAEHNVPYYKIPNLSDMNKIQVTCMPWIRYSNFKDPINKSEKSSKPKICWGQYYEINDKYYIDFSLLVNHAFQDGYHMGMLINSLQNNISMIDVNLYMEEDSYVKTKKKY